jgi:hypothetical protein
MDAPRSTAPIPTQPASDAPPAGTLLALAWRTEGDEDAMLEALEGGYRLTGNFRGREADVLAGALSVPRRLGPTIGGGTNLHNLGNLSLCPQTPSPYDAHARSSALSPSA